MVNNNKFKKVYLIRRENSCCDYIVSVYSSKEYPKKILEASKKKYLEEGYLVDEDYFDNDISKGLRVYKDLDCSECCEEDYEIFSIEVFNLLPKGYYNTSLGIEKYLNIE